MPGPPRPVPKATPKPAVPPWPPQNPKVGMIIQDGFRIFVWKFHEHLEGSRGHTKRYWHYDWVLDRLTYTSAQRVLYTPK